MIPKFRVFIKKIKKIAQVTLVDFEDNYLTCEIEIDDGIYQEFELNFDEVDFMQSTDLKDKNDIEIFEGDVVKFTDYWDDFGPEGLEGDIEGHNFGEVLMTVDGPKIGRVDEVGGCVHERQNEERASFSELVSSLDFEVVSNIYENLELLEGPHV